MTEQQVRAHLAALRTLRRQAGELAMFTAAHAVTDAIKVAETLLPAPAPPIVRRQALDMTGGVLTLVDQYPGDRYFRSGSDLEITATTWSEPFHFIIPGSGTIKSLVGFARCALEIAVVNPDGSQGPANERASYVVPAVKPPTAPPLAITLGDEPDGPAFVRVVGYDANGVRTVDTVSPWYGIVINRAGQAKDHPCYIRQWGSFEWTRTGGGVGNIQATAVCFKASARDEARPLIERAGIPFTNPAVSTDMVVLNVAQRSDLRTTPRRRSQLRSGAEVTGCVQGYEWQNVVRPDWTHLVNYGGERGVCMTPTILALYEGRRFKRYATSVRALWNQDSRGYLRCLFGEDWSQDYPPSMSELHGPKPDARVRYQGQPRPAGLVSARGVPLAPFTLPSGLEPCLQECWSIAVDDASTVSDPTLPEIGGEHPHAGNVAMALPDSRGIVWRLDFNGRDRSVPAYYAVQFAASDPWTVRLRNGIAFVTERTASKVTMYDFDTGQPIGTLIAADAQAAALGGLNASRYFNFSAGQTRSFARTLTGCPWPEGLWLEDSGDGTGYVYVGSYCLAEVRRWRVNWNDSIRHPSLISAQHEVAFRPWVDAEKSKYVLIEGNRTPAEPFGPAGWISVATWSNANYAKGFPDIYLPASGYGLNHDGDTQSTTLMTHAQRWNPFGPFMPLLPNGRNGVDAPGYAQAMSCAHARFSCSSAEDGINVLMKADPALDGAVLTSAQILALQDGAKWFNATWNVACGDYGGERPLPWGQYANCDLWLQHIGHVKPI